MNVERQCGLRLSSAQGRAVESEDIFIQAPESPGAFKHYCLHDMKYNRGRQLGTKKNRVEAWPYPIALTAICREDKIKT